MIRNPAEQRAEEQLRRLIGDSAYAVWEETGEIHIGSKLGDLWSATSNWHRGVTRVGESRSSSLAYPHWSIRRPRSPINPVKLWYWYLEDGKPWQILGQYHCVGAAWGFKGPVPMADQVIALCLWLHADEEAVFSKAFPKVRSLPQKNRAGHWDAIVSGKSRGMDDIPAQEVSG